MKTVIVTGATGFVGSNVLKQCILSKDIDRIVVLTRKPIDDYLSRSSKVLVIPHDEFSHWPSGLMELLQGAEGCLWAIGGEVDDFKDPETAKMVNIGYPIVAAEAFRDKVCPSLPEGQPFRFVYCSAWGAERNQNARLWTHSETRKTKGAAENGIFDVADSSSGRLEAYSLRPGGVIAEERGTIGAFASTVLPTVRADHLGKAFISVFLWGNQKHILENVDINDIGGLEASLSMNSIPL